MERIIQLPLSAQEAAGLRAGDRVSLSGELYIARDAAHKRFMDLLDAGRPLPFPLDGACIYYAGPTPAPPGRVIGAAGPTTSCRMDAYTPRLLSLGLRGMIGKGGRNPAVIAAIAEAGAVYFSAVGGAGALLSQRILAAGIIAFEDLGAEAVRLLLVKDFPAIVAVDSRGGDLYRIGRKAYLDREQRAGNSC